MAVLAEYLRYFLGLVIITGVWLSSGGRLFEDGFLEKILRNFPKIHLLVGLYAHLGFVDMMVYGKMCLDIIREKECDDDWADNEEYRKILDELDKEFPGIVEDIPKAVTDEGCKGLVLKGAEKPHEKKRKKLKKRKIDFEGIGMNITLAGGYSVLFFELFLNNSLLH
jgi:hypothetical protein